MARYAKLYNSPVPQTEPLNDRQVQNNAGGYVYQISIWDRLDRFLVLGSDANTYYQTAKALTRENAKCVLDCYAADPRKTVDAIVSVSHNGRAPKNDPAIFALALGAAHQDVKVRQIALAEMPHVCRTATHLFQFVGTTLSLGRGWGRSLKTAVAKWYNDKSVDDVAYQVIKYRDREGYTHKRLMQTAHPDPGGDLRRVQLYKWIWGRQVIPEMMPAKIGAHLVAMKPETSKKARLALVKEHKLPWEALPTECNTDPDYWAAQLPDMGLTALLRNLGNMSRHGLITPLSEAEKLIVSRFGDGEAIRKARLHPFTILYALKTYSSGHGFRGTNSWKVSQNVVDALDSAFYMAFKNVVPTGKNWLLGLDVSGSMSSRMANSNISCCEGTAALSLVTANVEPWTHIMGFAGPSNFVDLKISKKDSLAVATRKAQMNNFGSTDCAGAILYAQRNKLDVDTFCIMTDSETYAGGVHTSQALKEYRQKSGRNAKLIVVGMTSTGFSIADPNDPGMLDVVGFDASAPSVMADFARK